MRGSCSSCLTKVRQGVDNVCSEHAESVDARLYLYGTAFLSGEAARKALNIVKIAVSDTLASMVVQLVSKTSDALTKCCSLGPLQVVIQ